MDRAIGGIKRLEKHAEDTDSRLDAQEEWNTSCELTVKKQGKAMANPFLARAMMGLDHHEECPCGRDEQYAGIRRCYHCTKSFDSHDMAAHTAEAHHND